MEDWLINGIKLIIAAIALVGTVALYYAGINPAEDTFNWFRLLGLYYCFIALLAIAAGAAWAHCEKLLRRIGL